MHFFTFTALLIGTIIVATMCPEMERPFLNIIYPSQQQTLSELLATQNFPKCIPNLKVRNISVPWFSHCYDAI